MFRNVTLLFVFIALGFYELNGQELWNNLMFREYKVGFKVKNAKPLSLRRKISPKYDISTTLSKIM